jgi:hypothetical protein
MNRVALVLWRIPCGTILVISDALDPAVHSPAELRLAHQLGGRQGALFRFGVFSQLFHKLKVIYKKHRCYLCFAIYGTGDGSQRPAFEDFLFFADIFILVFSFYAPF